MQNHIQFGDTFEKAKLGDIVHLHKQEQEVVQCEETDVLMLNVDADELEPGDLRFIKALGLTISDPNTERPVAISVEDSLAGSVAAAAATYFVAKKKDDDDDDSSFFEPTSRLFGGHSSFGGFGGGGFGGFGGGGFSGGGASRSF